MTGLQMLLKQVGLDPQRVQLVFDQFTSQIPAYLNAVGQKVTSIDSRLARLELENAALREIISLIAAKLGVSYGINTDTDTDTDTKQLTASIGTDTGSDNRNGN